MVKNYNYENLHLTLRNNRLRRHLKYKLTQNLFFSVPIPVRLSIKNIRVNS